MRCISTLPRRSSHCRRGDAAKTVLISLLVVFVVLIVACAGLGLAGYFWFMRNFGQAFVTDPAGIRSMTAEIVDITIPAQFAPTVGNKIFGAMNVTYRWCPDGNCPTFDAMAEDEQWINDEGLNVLTLSCMAPQGAINDADDSREMTLYQYEDETLVQQFLSHTKEVRELTIRGRSCKFFIVKGVQKPWDEFDEDFDDADQPVKGSGEAEEQSSEPIGNQPDPDAPADALAAVTASETGSASEEVNESRKIVMIGGVFPGKAADVTLQLMMSPDDYDEELILQMLQSIH